MADVSRLRDIADQNFQTAGPVEADRPRAFISFPTQSYELLLFGGQIASLTSPQTLIAVMAYLQQAAHVNSMIHLFEEIETQTAGLPGAPLAGKKSSYLSAISNYCQVETPKTIQRLEQALGQGTGLPNA